MIDSLIINARKAMVQIKNYDQVQTDKMVRAIGKVVFDHAEELAKEAVAETRFGEVGPKTFKNQFFPGSLWQNLKGKQSVGILPDTDEEGIIKVAHPVGVVGSITPVTVPNICPCGNAMLALKGKNAIIISPHPKSLRSSTHTVNLMRTELEKIGAPADLIQIVPEASIEISAEVMKKCDVVVATGGPGMVKAAYSSGKPAYGVGAGNSQVICEDIQDYEEFSRDAVANRMYDNGTSCLCMNALIYLDALEKKIFESLRATGNVYIAEDPEIVDKFRETLFVNGAFNKEMAGRDVQFVSKAAGVEIDKDVTVVILKVDKYGKDEILCYEKVCPVCICYSVKNIDEALHIALENYELQGKGHTAGVYSSNRDTIIKVGETLPVCRLLVNQPTSDGASGPHNSLNPTNSIGCGSWGNNSISENLTYKHLLNIQRIAMRIDAPPVDYTNWD